MKQGAIIISTRRSAAVILLFLLTGSSRLTADAIKHEWFGTWSMNHDGHVGTLWIGDTKADCAAPVWCDMAIKYTDAQGQQYAVEIEAIDDHLQHMVFRIKFPNNVQKFDAYLFSWDKTTMAGTTYWGGQNVRVLGDQAMIQ